MKAFFLVLAVVLCAILITQNTDVIALQFLFWQVEMSLVALILFTLVLGVIIGDIGGGIIRRGGDRKA